MSDIALGHVHDWSNKRTIDRCHQTVIEKTCKTCGTVHQDSMPRDFKLHPLDRAFAREDCARCRQMLKGHEPEGWA